MDRSQHEATLASSNRTNPLSARPSIDVSPTPPRLQKKRSVKRVQSNAKRLTGKSVDNQATPQPANPATQRSPELTGDISRQKSTSLRNAVRKLFGRRSRIPEAVPPPPSSIQSTPMKHKAHRSEPPDISQQTELPPRPNTADRAASASLHGESPTNPLRLRSPNAVEFPRSRQLKPLALPAPFEDPRATLRRRKTLPSILIPEQDAKEIAAAIASAGPYPSASSFDLAREPANQPSGLVAGTTKSIRRRSRSAGDLKEQALQAGPVRKRSDEIRFWRESIQHSWLRSSGFVAMADEDVEPLIEPQEPAETPLQRKENSPIARNRVSLRTSPPFEVNSASAYGTEFSRDLEDRVAKLEANLNVFQRSLQKLQTDKSRRAGLVGIQLRNKRDSDDARTPSMLVDDLQLPFAQTKYRYEYEPGPRPSTAPSRPSRPFRPDADAPPVPPLVSPNDPLPPSLPPPPPPAIAQQPPQRQPPARPTRPDKEPELAQRGPPPRPTRPDEEPDRPPQRPPPVRPIRPDESPAQPSTTATPPDGATFRSLYRMLTDERSARRRLETEVRDLRTEISDLHNQVNAHSPIQSQRSSYLFSASSEAGAGSARLRDLLGQLEGPTSQYNNPPPRGSALTEAVVSRFSGSTRQESEGGAPQEEARASSVYDSERTPRPDQAKQLGGTGQQEMEFEALDGPYAAEQSNYKLATYRRQQEVEDEEGEMF